MKRTRLVATMPLLMNLNGVSSFQVRHFVIRSVNENRIQLRSSINADQINTSNTKFDFPTMNSIEYELKCAIERARDTDKRYGLCTEPSQQAWSLVDSLYEKMQLFQDETYGEIANSNKQEGH